MSSTETFEQFCERMSHVEKTKELIIGSRYSGNTRTVFEFEGQACYLETFSLPDYVDLRRRGLPPMVACVNAIMHPPTYCWIHSRLFYTEARAKMLAKRYKAEFHEDEYPLEAGVWFYLSFVGDDDWERIMRLVWDIHTGAFKTRFGDEEKKYQSCIGYDPKEAVKAV